MNFIVVVIIIMVSMSIIMVKNFINYQPKTFKTIVVIINK